jgi:hypothetical protein
MPVLSLVLLRQERLLRRRRPAGAGDLLGAGRGVERGDEGKVLVRERAVADAESGRRIERGRDGGRLSS